MVALFSAFKGASISIVVAPIYIPINNVGRLPFLHTLSIMLFIEFLMMVILAGVK